VAGDPISTDLGVGRQLEAALDLLGMDLAYVAEVHGSHQVYRAAEGDELAFGLEVGEVVPSERSVCSVAGSSLPRAIPDTGRRQGVRSFVSVPVRLADGHFFGSLCCVSRRTNPALGRRDVHVLEALAKLIADRLEHDRLAADLRALERETGKRRVEATGVGAFLAAIGTRDTYTGRHSDALVGLAVAVAETLDLASDERRAVGQVALLHDIGKIGVPDAILQKRGPLSDEEWGVMRTHPELGARMVGSVVGLGHLAPSVRAGHERWDGGGYPDGLRGEEIPLTSRIVFACDAFHAMTSDRPYRRALGRGDAVAELERGSGSQFCPATTEALLMRLSPAEPAVSAA
jgi:response regulator RpfG family c-di-GMP phosphodiesterase